jgi:hypothetical protein
VRVFLLADDVTWALAGWHDGWAWFWMIPMMLFWIVGLGAVVYAAVRPANRDSRQH